MQKSVEQHRKLLLQKVKEAENAINSCVLQYLSFGTGKRQQSVARAYDAVTQVSNLIHSDENPGWLRAILVELKRAVAEKDNNGGAEAIQRVATVHYPQMIKHDWNASYVDSERVGGIDIDLIYSNCRTELGIQEQFEEIIECLREIVDSGEINYIDMREELLSIIAMLESSIDGSFFATHTCLDFLKVWMENAKWEGLNKLPVAGPLLKSLRTSLDKTGVTLQELQIKFYLEVKTKIESTFPSLGYNPPCLPTQTDVNPSIITDSD